MKCFKCQREPEELIEYQDAASESGMNIRDYVKFEEGTYDPQTDYFLCTPCYINLDMPIMPEILMLYQKGYQ